MSVRRTPHDVGDAVVAIERRLQRLELRGRGYSIDDILTGVTTYSQDEEPTGGEYTEGDLWFDTDDGNKVYRWNGTDWVPVLGTTNDRVRDDAAAALVSVQDFEASADGLVTTYVQASAPSLHVVGDLWIDTDDNMLYRWSGSAWVSTGNTEVGEKVTKTQNQLSYADGRIVTWWQFNEPTATGFGDLWVDTNSGNQLYRWNNLDWLKVLDWSLVQLEDQLDTKISTYRQDTVPVSKAIGDIWVDTAHGNKQYRAQSVGADEIIVGEWIEIQDEAIGDAQETADEAQDAADEAQDTADEAIHFVASKNTVYRVPDEPDPPLDLNGDPVPFTVGDIWFDTDDGNEPRTWDGTDWVSVRDAVAAEAAAAAEAAQEAADAAAADAAAALELGASKAAVYYQDGAPTGGTYATSDTWFDTNDGNKQYKWNGSTWVAAVTSWLQTNPSASFPGLSVSPAGLAAYDGSGNLTVSIDSSTGGFSSTGSILAGGSITGSVITGGTVQTTTAATTGIKLNSLGFVAYNSSGAATFTITAATGGIVATGPILSGGTITGALLQTTGTFNRGVKMDATGLYGYSSSGANTFSLSASTGSLVLTGGVFTGADISGSTVTGGTVQTETTALRGIKMSSTGLTAYNGTGTPTFTITASTGAINMSGSLISGAAITGSSLVTTGGTGARVEIGTLGSADSIMFYNSSGAMIGRIISGTGAFTIGVAGNTINLAAPLNAGLQSITGANTVSAQLFTMLGGGTFNITGSLSASLNVSASTMTATNGGTFSNGIDILSGGLFIAGGGLIVSGGSSLGGTTTFTGAVGISSGAGNLNLNNNNILAVGAITVTTINGGPTVNGGMTVNGATVRFPDISSPAAGYPRYVQFSGSGGQIAAGASVASSLEMKDDIVSLSDYLPVENVYKINTYKFVYKDDPDREINLGVMAHELDELGFGPLLQRDSAGAPYAVHYTHLAVPALMGVQDLYRKYLELKAEVAALRDQGRS